MPDWSHPRIRAIVIGLTIGIVLGIVVGLLLRRERARDEAEATETFACPSDVASVTYAIEPLSAPPLVTVTMQRLERRIEGPEAGSYTSQAADITAEDFASVVRATCEEPHPVRVPQLTVGANPELRVASTSGARAGMSMKDRDLATDPSIRAFDELARRHFGEPIFGP